MPIESDTGRIAEGVLGTGAEAIGNGMFKLGTAVFDDKSMKALSQIRFEFKNGRRLKVPKKAFNVFEQFAKVKKADVFAILGTHAAGMELLERIEEQMDTVRQDPIFAAQVGLTAERVLATSFLLFVKAAGFKRLWKKAKFGRLKLAVLPEAEYSTNYMGRTFKGVVEGLTRLTGTVEFPTHVSGITTKVQMFPKFVTHPFHQYGRMG